MTEYLRLSMQVDKLKRRLQRAAAACADAPGQLAELFDRECNAIRQSASQSYLEWVSDRLQDVAFECGIAEFDSSVLRLVRAGIMAPEELFAEEYDEAGEEVLVAA